MSEAFGFNEFRGSQEEIINSICSGKNCLGIMPTGSGKSLCFQIPALKNNKLTLVVSPLIALMKDQVESLQKKGIHSAFYLNSTMSQEAIMAVLKLIEMNKIKLLYIAPEALKKREIIQILQKKVGIFVIDEAHCIVTWGKDFRPEYQNLREYTNLLGNPPILALTATANQEMIKEIEKNLSLRFEVFEESALRKNIYIEVLKDAEEKEDEIIGIIKNISGHTIIFCALRETTEEISSLINSINISALPYHAGLSKEQRKENQDKFMNDEVRIIVATKAFGMGIDKKDIRNVIHYNLPQTIEDYYQEIGRGGRDGKPTRAIVFCSNNDINKTKSRIFASFPGRQKLGRMLFSLKEYRQSFIPITKSLIAKTIDINEAMLNDILERLEKNGAIKVQPATGLIYIEEKIMDMDVSSFEEIFTLARIEKMQKFNILANCLTWKSCITKQILNYLGKTYKEEVCNNCSVCSPEKRFCNLV